MISEKQKEAFLQYEANAWFQRNQGAILSYSSKNDNVVGLIKKYNISPSRILEIGCSSGYRLNALLDIYPDVEAFGIDPSSEAINFGTDIYPNINLKLGSADDLSVYPDNSMDVVIIGFVFYVIDRDLILKVISEINRVLKNGGILIIVDFFSEIPRKNNYHHIVDFNAFCFKQNYDEIFTSTKIYFMIDKCSWNHNSKVFDASENYHDKCIVSTLKKDINAGYI